MSAALSLIDLHKSFGLAEIIRGVSLADSPPASGTRSSDPTAPASRRCLI